MWLIVFVNSKVAVVACMDARLDPAKALGLSEGDAHVIRNAGGRTVDALRSIVISQQLLGTREIAIVHHVRTPLSGRRLTRHWLTLLRLLRPTAACLPSPTGS